MTREEMVSLVRGIDVQLVQQREHEKKAVEHKKTAHELEAQLGRALTVGRTIVIDDVAVTMDGWQGDKPCLRRTEVVT